MRIKNIKGFSHHLLLPVLAILVVGLIGVYAMTQSSAATKLCKNRVFKQGSSSACVRVIQRVTGAKVDAVFGAETAKKVKTFQGKHGLTKDGAVGAKTWTAICSTAKTKYPSSYKVACEKPKKVKKVSSEKLPCVMRSFSEKKNNKDTCNKYIRVIASKGMYEKYQLKPTLYYDADTTYVVKDLQNFWSDVMSLDEDGKVDVLTQDWKMLCVEAEDQGLKTEYAKAGCAQLW